MDDLARAADVSRQGLYLHFDTKEALFKAAILRLVGALRAAWRAALDRHDADTEERIASAFEALHGFAIHEPGSAGLMNELLETAKSLVGPAVDEVERELISAVAQLLASSGIAAGWAEAGLSAKELAETLWAASSGLKHTSASAATHPVDRPVRAQFRERAIPSTSSLTPCSTVDARISCSPVLSPRALVRSRRDPQESTEGLDKTNKESRATSLQDTGSRECNHGFPCLALPSAHGQEEEEAPCGARQA